MLGAEGLRIPGLDTEGGHEKFGPIPLDHAALELLLALSRGTEDPAGLIQEVVAGSGGSSEELNQLLDALTDRGLVVSGPPSTGGSRLAVTSVGPPLAEARVYVQVPRLFRLHDGAFEHVDEHCRRRFPMTSIELAVASEFRTSRTCEEAHAAHLDACGSRALSLDAVRELARCLDGAGLLVHEPKETETPARVRRRQGRSTFGSERASRSDWERFQAVNQYMKQAVRDFDASEEERETRSPHRVRVVGVQQNGTILPLALGMLFAAAQSHDGGRLKDYFAFHPDWLFRPSKVRSLVRHGPAIFLFSNYNWSHQHNQRVSKKAKTLSPGSLTIHGGPNTPSYRGDCEAYFRDNPDVDIVVRGEGEVTFCALLDALKGRLGGQPVDLSILAGIDGISFRLANGKIVHAPSRARVNELDDLPSPILLRMFDGYRGSPLGIFESNRGCPFKCTFCDWGSATNSKVRRFSLDRVFAELEWFAEHEIAGLMCADANFGMYARDVEIARKVAELRKATGFPQGFSASFAKNTVKHTRQIIEILAEAGVVSHASLGVQSMDPATLATVRRSNIQIEKFDELVTEFSRAGLRVWVDMMFGLPGQTRRSFGDDLQACIDRGVFPRLFMTELLVNSPMNEPAYREENRIETRLAPDRRRNLIVRTASFSEDDFVAMNELRLLFVLCDTIGMLRQLAHFVRQETGLREIDYYVRLGQDIAANPERFPTLTFSIRALPSLLIPPVSWELAIEEAGRHAIEELGVTDDSALRTVLSVQRALLPATGRSMPVQLELEHDYAAWHAAMVEATRAGNKSDWHLMIPRLANYGPAPFSVEDPEQICVYGIGSAVDGDLFGNFELRSPVARWNQMRSAARLPL
jgi:radical SAM superfamily enzyme YgiQ (UPF0313 family)